MSCPTSSGHAGAGHVGDSPQRVRRSRVRELGGSDEEARGGFFADRSFLAVQLHGDLFTDHLDVERVPLAHGLQRAPLGGNDVGAPESFE